MKTYYSNPIKMSLARKAELMAVVLWSAHYHGGQASREYRLGCLAQMLLRRSNEIGGQMVSRWFDTLEPYINGGEMPRTCVPTFAENVKRKYAKLESFSQRDMAKKGIKF